MSSTSNVQNLLTNVFRPVFVYDTTNGVYQTKLELTNVDSVSANTVYTFAASVGDPSGNVYVGTLAGNDISVLAIKANSNSTFIGTSAGSASCNIVESVFIGYRAGASAASSSYSVSIGATSKSAGNSNVFIGYGAGVISGSNNIFIGTNVTNTGNINNKLLVGSGPSAAMIVGDLTNNRMGVNLSTLPTTTPNVTLDVNGFTRIGTNANGGLGINMLPGNFALDVTGAQRIQDGVGTLTFSNGIQTSTGGFNSITGISAPLLYTEPTNIGVWKKGLVMVSAQDISNSTNFTSQLAMVCLTGTTYTVTAMSSINSNATITASTSNIVLTNNVDDTRRYNYSITYFPRP
jgi:hypothetical protein